jgi:Tail-tube assembly protein
MALRYPIDLPDKYYLSINFKKYERPSVFDSLLNLITIPNGQIVLPIPSNLVDRQDLNWTAEDGYAAEALSIGSGSDVGALGIITSGRALSGLGDFIAGSLGANDVNKKALERTNAERTGQAIGKSGASLANALLQKSGLTLNPMLTQMFNSPEFKQHQFSWKFSPDNITESKTLQSIIDTIKYQSLPNVQGGGAFFGYPSIAEIKIKTGSRELYKLKPCVVTSVSVNYAPTGIPSFFHIDSHASEIEFSASFIEIILNTRNNTEEKGNFDFGLGSTNNTSFDNFTGGITSGISDILKFLGKK